MAASIVGIWNRALQLLGASSVQSVSDTSKTGVECAKCYEVLRDKFLELHPFRFALEIATIAADNPAPDWGKTNSFTLPDDFLCLYADYEEYNSLDKDWEVQDGKIYTDDAAPLYIRYVAKVTDPNKMTPSFRELLSAGMADAMCEALTQSNSKKVAMERALDKAWKEARRANSRLTRSQSPPDDPYITARR
jgi:hypothetical protein